VTEPVAARPKVFISYSHKDETWKDKIVDHLSIVAREEDFDVWQDRKIDPGSEWYETIVHQIEEAGVAILLVSVDFLKSDFIRNEEVKLVWDDMASLLPAEWPEKQKLSFLSWLAGPAGLLTDRADGTLSFAHLSFQEYLTAWRLNAEVESAEKRAETFERLAKNEIWWETLRLWAALVEKQSRLKLGTALTSLIGSGESGLMLAGAIFADGLGTEESFGQWAEKLSLALGSAWLGSCGLCAQAWASSRQDERKAELTRRLAEAAPTQTWLGWLRFEEFARGLSDLGGATFSP